jgi:hypothetical protein
MITECLDYFPEIFSVFNHRHEVRQQQELNMVLNCAEWLDIAPNMGVEMDKC